MVRDLAPLKLACAVILTVSSWDIGFAQSVPLPRPRPAAAGPAQPTPAPKAQAAKRAAPTAEAPKVEAAKEDATKPEEAAQPSACRIRLTSDLAIAPSLPPIVGPGECGAPDLVKLEAVVMPDQSRVAFTPPATLRCTMAEALVTWVREDASAMALDLGGVLRSIQNFDSYDCRGRNRVVGAKTSEHGKGNAFDMRGLRLANGKFLEFTDPTVARDFRERARKSVCGRFTTVLGPGSDGYHETHIHVDLAERRGGYRMCQWDVRDPVPVGAIATTIPLPPPRPKIDDKSTSGSKL
jgi:hypothetical protein